MFSGAVHITHHVISDRVMKVYAGDTVGSSTRVSDHQQIICDTSTNPQTCVINRNEGCTIESC